MILNFREVFHLDLNCFLLQLSIWLYPLQRRKTPPKNSCLMYNTELHLIVKLQFWKTWRVLSTPSLQLLLSPLRPGVVVPYLPNPSARAGYDTRSIFKRSLTGLNSEFSVSYTKAEEPSLSYYLPIAGGRIIGFIPFPGVLMLCETQSVSSRIWIRVAVSIFYDDNHYTTSTSWSGSTC